MFLGTGAGAAKPHPLPGVSEGALARVCGNRGLGVQGFRGLGFRGVVGFRRFWEFGV